MMTEHEYWCEIRSLAGDCLAEAIEDGEVTDADSLHDWLWQTIDGHEYVIYTAKAQAVLAISPNDGAYIDEYGTDGLVEDGCLNWSRLAYGAMDADLREALPDIDWDDDDARAGWLTEHKAHVAREAGRKAP